MTSINKTARLAGLFWILTATTGGYTLVYVRSKLFVSGNAVATIGNIRAFEGLFRASIASSILNAVFTLLFGLMIFHVFREVKKATATAFLASLIAAATIAGLNAINNFAALLILGDADYLKAFNTDQLAALSMIFLRINNYVLGVAEIFTAFYLFSLGLLIFRTSYVPKFLGILLMIGACAFPVNTLLKILFPHFFPAMTQVTMMLNALGAPLTMLWLTFMGVKEPQPLREAARA